MRDQRDALDLQASLRAAMDSDLGVIRTEQRAQRGMLQAVGITLSEHGAMLRNQGIVLAEHSNILAEHSATLAEHSAILGSLKTGIQTIIDLLTQHMADGHKH